MLLTALLVALAGISVAALLLSVHIYTFMGYRHARPTRTPRQQIADTGEKEVASMKTLRSGQCVTLSSNSENLQRVSSQQQQARQMNAQFRAMEDAVFIHRDWAILSNYDRDPMFRRSNFTSAAAVPFYYPLIALHVPSQKLFEMPLRGYPSDIAFRPHGLDVHRLTETSGVILVVNHALAHGGERVEHLVYHIPSAQHLHPGAGEEKAKGKNAKRTKGRLSSTNVMDEVVVPQLRYQQSLLHRQLLQQGVINDVAIQSFSCPRRNCKSHEVSLSFFLTRWRPLPMDVSRWPIAIDNIVAKYALLLNLPMTYIIFCTASPATEAERKSVIKCTVPKGQYFTGMYNGIAMSSDKSRLLAVDMSSKAVAAYEIHCDTASATTSTCGGDEMKLRLIDTLFSSHMIDNIALDEVRSTPARDVLTTAGNVAYHLITAPLEAYSRLGYDAFRGAMSEAITERIGAPYQFPSAMQTLDIEYQRSSDGHTSVRSSNWTVEQLSLDGGWSVSAVYPFHGKRRPIASEQRLFILGSFIERYVLLCSGNLH